MHPSLKFPGISNPTFPYEFVSSHASEGLPSDVLGDCSGTPLESPGYFSGLLWWTPLGNPLGAHFDVIFDVCDGVISVWNRSMRFGPCDLVHAIFVRCARSGPTPWPTPSVPTPLTSHE